MLNKEITLSLSEDLIARATAAGVLTDERLSALLEAELTRQKRLDSYFETLDKLAALEPPLTPDEINEEIRAYREEKRRGAATETSS